MRRILLALGLTVATVMAGEMGICQKNCGIDFGKCLITTGDFKSCLKSEAACSLDCLKSKSAKSGIKVSQNIGVCEKNCGIDYGKCLITTFDMNTCTKQQAACALDCLKGVKSKPFKIQVKNNVGICEKNCGIDFGKCLITTGDFKSCLKDQASCALDCLKSVSVAKGVAQSQNMGVCQKNCAIDYSKCLITTFDMATCSKQEAACALDCLKSTEVAKVEEVEDVEFSIKCSLCKAAAGKIQGIISKLGCGASRVAIGLACEAIFFGPEDPIADACAIGFYAACPTLLKWIQGKVFTTDKACHLVHLC